MLAPSFDISSHSSNLSFSRFSAVVITKDINKGALGSAMPTFGSDLVAATSIFSRIQI